MINSKINRIRRSLLAYQKAQRAYRVEVVRDAQAAQVVAGVGALVRQQRAHAELRVQLVQQRRLGETRPGIITVVTCTMLRQVFSSKKKSTTTI